MNGMRSARQVRANLIGDLESAEYVVSQRPGRYEKCVNVMDIDYIYEGRRRMAGAVVSTRDRVVLLAYPSQRSAEMVDVAQSHNVLIVTEEPSFRAVESYLAQKGA